MDQASEVFKTNEDHELLTSLKQAALQANKARVDELAQKFQEHSEQIQEVSVFFFKLSLDLPDIRDEGATMKFGVYCRMLFRFTMNSMVILCPRCANFYVIYRAQIHWSFGRTMLKTLPRRSAHK